MSRPVIVVWLRSDLRVVDNPALAAAARDGRPLLPLFVLDERPDDPWRPAEVSRRRQAVALARLRHALGERGSRLIVRRGRPNAVLAELIDEVQVGAVFWNERHEPYEREVQTEVAEFLRGRGIETRRFEGNLLFDPDAVRTTTGDPYRVFTPFWRACLALESGMEADAGSIASITAPARWPRSEELDLPQVSASDPGLETRLDAVVAGYAANRDRPDLDGTSRLSAALHFGEIGPRRLWRRVRELSDAGSTDGAQAFLRQLAWREFAHHLLHHYPETPDVSMRRSFEHFPWRDDQVAHEQWKRGETGYPIVDAGMRQLARTGWMHNRVRLITGSFLVKHLLIDWREGARHFWQTLEDADLANNTLGWQWIAGCGVDAAPYFRIFNPVLQARRFDPAGAYVRAWLPEIAALPDRWIHQPWEAPAEVLESAGVRLGRDYPRPVVDLAAGRQRALDALQEISGASR